MLSKGRRERAGTMWGKKIKSGCDQYNVWDSELSWQLTVNSFMLTFLYPIPPLHSSWTASVFKLHLTFWTWEQGLAKNTTKPLWECFRPWPLHLTTVSHYLDSLTNSFWHSYHFSVRRCPFTQISLAQRTAFTGNQTSQCVKGRGVTDPDPWITGASALWPSFGSQLYSVGLNLSLSDILFL